MEQEKIRNFSIISHIDAGKSTLADRFLELTGTVEKKKMHAQYLDMMDLEQEKGITIKLQPVRMEYNDYVLNLIDTPGHVDFSYEVSRSLAAVEGAVLLVDASQGVQAQTLANLHLALEQNLKIIPVINKIDLATAQVDETEKEIRDILHDNGVLLKVSAKTGENVEKVLGQIIKKIPSPSGMLDSPFRALIFDSIYDLYKGVILFVRVVDGKIKKGDEILAIASKAKSEVLQVGVFNPQLFKKEALQAGEIGYVATGLKDVSLCRVGDTITTSNVHALPGYKEPQPMVWASLYTSKDADFNKLKDSLNKLKLNDASLIFEVESSSALGMGFKTGFLGMLHMEIVVERLKREYNIELIITSPNVVYKLKGRGKKEKEIYKAEDLLDKNLFEWIKEPWTKIEVVTPNKYLGSIMKLLEQIGGVYKNTRVLGVDRTVIEYQAPLREIIIKKPNQTGPFYDLLKNVSSGFASMNYEVSGWQKADLIKLDILVAGEKVEAFSKIIPKDRAQEEGRALVKKLKYIIPPQLFTVALQAVIGGKIIARENICAKRKDVTGHLYGGDYTRKRKLLEKQKKGKKKLKSLGKVNIPAEAFLRVFRK